MARGDDQLQQFVSEALHQGLDRARIREALLTAGWTADRVDAALRAWAAVPFPVPVPRPQPSLSARAAFLHLLLFATLYISAWDAGKVIFYLIEHAFPDPAAGSLSERSLRWSLAGLIVAFPIFVFSFRAVQRLLAREPEVRASAGRRWMIGITLFLAALFVIGDLTAVVHGLLGGELTVRFALKALTVAVIAGGIFVYFLQGLRQAEEAQ